MGTVLIASMAAVALAVPEADPALVYGGLGYAGHLGHLGYAGLPLAGVPLASVGAVPHVPVVKGVVETPAEVATEVTAHTIPIAVGYHGLGYGGHYLGKRSADADPAIIAGATKILTPPTPFIHNAPVRPVIAHAPLGYGYGLGLGHHAAGYGLPAAHVLAKRDADAQLIAGLPYAGLAHAYAGYAGLPLAAAHAVPHHPIVKSVVETPAEVATEVTA